MVKKTGFDDGSFILVDFDSCGGIKKLRFPFCLNTKTVKRPRAAGGAIIETEHDLEMLDTIWDY